MKSSLRHPAARTRRWLYRFMLADGLVLLLGALWMMHLPSHRLLAWTLLTMAVGVLGILSIRRICEMQMRGVERECCQVNGLAASAGENRWFKRRSR